jgi:ankyrin repeat protein
MKSLNSYTHKPAAILSFIMFLLVACTSAGNDSQDRNSQTTPETDIHTAVLTGNLEAVQQHIEAGTDINQKDQMTGSTPLITAATFGKTHIAQTLIDAGADLSVTNNDGSTALHAAAFFCRVEIVQLLLDGNADKTIRNNFGATARESVVGPFDQIKPVYNMMQEQLSPFGMNLDMAEIEKTRPVIAMMLQ